MTEKIIATLELGKYYDYNGKIWNAHASDGKPAHPVTAEEKEYLQEHAIVSVNVDGEQYEKQRFSFSDDAPSKPAVRQRNRKPAE